MKEREKHFIYKSQRPNIEAFTRYFLANDNWHLQPGTHLEFNVQECGGPVLVLTLGLHQTPDICK
jgi:hypothetical protein